MPTKTPANQHEVLHRHYGEHDCCLCKLEKQLQGLNNIGPPSAMAGAIIGELRESIEYFKQRRIQDQQQIQDKDIKINTLEMALSEKINSLDRAQGDLATFESNAVKQIDQLNLTIEKLQEQLAAAKEEKE